MPTNNSSANHDKARILIADDHPIVRQGLGQMLNGQPDLCLCCEAGDANEALAAAKNCSHDLAIVDISLQGVSGLSLISALAAQSPTLPILVMSMHEESLYAERALRLGARGYIMKQQASIDILTAIRHILSGGIFLSEDMRSIIVNRIHAHASKQTTTDPTASLTAREFEILRLIGFGFSTRQIADKMQRSVKTIEAHRANIKEKLGLATGLALIRFATLWIKTNE